MNNEPKIFLNIAEWREMSQKEQQRMVINMVNRINRRMGRLEEAGFTDMRGYEMLEQLTRMKDGIYKAKTGGKPRLTKAINKMTDTELYRYYRRMSETTITPSAEFGHTTQTVRGVRKKIKEMGTTANGKVLFTPEEYSQLTPEEKKKFWSVFHKYRDYLKKLGKYLPGRVNARREGRLPPSVAMGESFEAFKNIMGEDKKDMTKILKSHFSENRAKRIMELGDEIWEAAHPGFENEAIPDYDDTLEAVAYIQKTMK